jgi:Transposase DDE domain group 1
MMCDAAQIEAVFVDLFLDAHSTAPPQITLDLDATDDPLHGHQEGRFFHGYYDNYCYLPLYVFCGRHLLASKLRPANIDGSAGSLEEVARIVARIRQRWPQVRILLRADSGFARDRLMTWCESNGVDYLFGLAKNSRLVEAITISRANSPKPPSRARKPASRPVASRTLPGRRATAGATSAASSPRRNGPRARPTHALSSPRWRARSTRPATSTRSSIAPAARWRTASRNASSTFMPIAPQPKPCAPTRLRLWFAAIAYVLICALRRIGLAHTQFARAACGTIRLKLLKIGALVRTSVRRIKLAMPSAFPYQTEYLAAHAALNAAATA